MMFCLITLYYNLPLIFICIYIPRFDPDLLDDDEFEALTEGERQEAEAMMRQRDRAEGRNEGRLRRGLLYDDSDEDDDAAGGPSRTKRRRQAEMAAMEVIHRFMHRVLPYLSIYSLFFYLQFDNNN